MADNHTAACWNSIFVDHLCVSLGVVMGMHTFESKDKFYDWLELDLL
jgi:hypothetical protein